MSHNRVHGGVGSGFVTEPDMSGVAFSLPTGTVTFLLTDVEGSSRRWEDAPEAMTVAIPRHYEILDAAIAKHGGVRPVEQGEGDSVVGAFARASDAAAAALDAQLAFAAEPWPDAAPLRVRMAIHTGEAQLRDAGNYFGQTVIRCARIRAVGFGGQVLVSEAAAAVIGERLPAGASLVDLGVHRLKDLGRPERLWQLAHQDLVADHPPLRSLDLFRHNLPVQLTPLIGRGTDVVDVATRLADDRLVTLTGSGGVGKTRLAAAVAGELVDRYPGGAWWVELAAVNDADAVGRAVLAALGAPEASGRLAQQVAVELGPAPSLLVLDNCEHVIAPAADLVADLLAANPAVTVLTTSREPLGVPGEVTWRVPSLAAPAPDRDIDVPALSQFDAVRLFVDRARRARPSFAVDEANAPSIAQICHRLDGVPLAIELAAARCRQLSVDQIANALDDRFRLLTGGARTVMARQQTLQASVEWSHDLLDDDERRVFRRLGVFAGSFPLDGAEAVASAPGDVDAIAVLDVITRLVEKSLVVVGDGVDGGIRYRLLETLRAFALDRARAEDDLTVLRDAHAQWLIAWFEPMVPHPTDAVVDLVDELHDNVVAGLEWGVGNLGTGLRLLYAVGRPWQSLGRGGAALAHADRLLHAPGAEEHGTAWAYGAATMAILYLQSQRYVEWFDLLDRIERVGTEHDDDYLVALARWFRSGLGREESEVLRDRARERASSWVISLTETSLARHLIDDPVVARPAVTAATEYARGVGNSYLINNALVSEAILDAETGHLDRALAAARQVLTDRSPATVGFGVRVLALVGLTADDEAAVRLAVEVDDRSRRKAPEMTAPTSDPERALRLVTGGDPEVHPALAAGTPPVMSLQPLHSPLDVWLAAREAIDAGGADVVLQHIEAFTRPTPAGHAVLAAARGAATGDESHWHDALATAVAHDLRTIAIEALEGLAVGAERDGNIEVAGRLLGAAERARAETAYRWRFRSERDRVERVRAAAPPSAFDAGGALSWDDAIAYAQRAHGTRKRPTSGWESLTPTEHQVVALVAEGMTNPQVADKLLMGRATVKTHLEHVYAKLGVRNRAELAAAAARRERPGHERDE